MKQYVLLACTVVAVVGCKNTKPHIKCTDASQCTLAERPGYCIDGSCAVADGSCPSGYRFDVAAGASGECVAPTAPPDMAPAPDLAKPECTVDADCINGGSAPCGGSCVDHKCSYAGPVVDCGSSCTGTTETHRACDGRGSCGTSTLDCGVYTCAGEHCRQTCTDAATDCAGTQCTNSQCVACPSDMIWIPAATFTMGTPDTGPHTSDTVAATVSKGFCIDRREVSVAQFKACVTAGVCAVPPVWTSCAYNAASGDDLAMNCVDWKTAGDYCAWVGARRLPWEVEWELAARGTDARTYPWGEATLTCGLANYWDSTRDVHCTPDATKLTPVGSHSPSGDSPYGLQDAAGNVAEWTQDCFVMNYTAGGACTKTCTDPRGPGDPATCTGHTVRGGAATTPALTLPTYARVGSTGNRTFGDFVEYGFRCAK